jgi:hypothetical protein
VIYFALALNLCFRKVVSQVGNKGNLVRGDGLLLRPIPKVGVAVALILYSLN